ncbi:MAG: hypothetical protein ACC618_03320 [Patescibacteria group bacterium]
MKLLLLLSATLFLALVLVINALNIKTKKPSEIQVEPVELDVILSEELIGDAPPFEIPEGIHPNQLQKYYFTDGSYYAIYQKANLNYPIKNSTNRSGILYANEGDKKWRIFLEIKELAKSKNNPVNFWKENDSLFVIIVDADGAGSGEGIAKLFESKDNGTSWEIKKCFYLTFDQFYGTIKAGITEKGLSITQAIDEYLALDNTASTKEYVFNPQTGKYESGQFNKYTGESKTLAVDNCQNFELR